MAVLYYVYLATVMIAWLISIWRFRRIDRGGRVISILLGLTFVLECLAFLFARRHGNNMMLYGLFSLIQAALLAFYFNETIDVFRRRRIGLWIGAVVVVLGLLNMRYLQPLRSYNSYFLLLESILVISMSLFSFARLMLRNDSQRIVRNPHFWITAILTFFWSATFFNWGFYEYMIATQHNAVSAVNMLLLMVNIGTYGALGVVFYRYPISSPQRS